MSTKAAWIREQPATMTTADVVAKAQKEGITITPAMVYTVRSMARPRECKPMTDKDMLDRAGGNALLAFHEAQDNGEDPLTAAKVLVVTLEGIHMVEMARQNKNV